MATRARARNALEQHQRLGGARTIGFCVSQRHADFMAEFFTESRILWLQQFGRGLRHLPGKTLRVIDYIGNHRVFLTKTRALFGLGAGDRAVAYALEQLAAGTMELPPGCSVTYDLQAIDILRSLLRPVPAGDQLRAYY